MDKESTQGQTKGSTFSLRRESTQVEGQWKKQIEQPMEVEECPSFQDVPMGHDVEQPQEEAHAETKP